MFRNISKAYFNPFESTNEIIQYIQSFLFPITQVFNDWVSSVNGCDVSSEEVMSKLTRKKANRMKHITA